MNTSNFYDLWKLTEDEQRELLGEVYADIKEKTSIIVVELDEYSMRYFYNERFAPIAIRQYKIVGKGEFFQVIVHSIDDSSLNMTWEVKEMTMRPDEARLKIDDFLKRTGYFIVLKGFETFCKLFGKFNVNYN